MFKGGKRVGRGTDRELSNLFLSCTITQLIASIYGSLKLKCSTKCFSLIFPSETKCLPHCTPTSSFYFFSCLSLSVSCRSSLTTPSHFSFIIFSNYSIHIILSLFTLLLLNRRPQNNPLDLNNFPDEYSRDGLQLFQDSSSSGKPFLINHPSTTCMFL